MEINAFCITLAACPVLLLAAVAFLIVAVASFVAFATLIRCPKCHKPISWMVLTTRPSGRWLNDLFALEECPICDDRGGTA